MAGFRTVERLSVVGEGFCFSKNPLAGDLQRVSSIAVGSVWIGRLFYGLE